MVDDTVAPVWSIYKVTCLVNGKAYVGLTRGSPINRWRNHIWRANSKTKSIVRFALHWAVGMYGSRNFRLEVLSTHHSLSAASAAEQAAIAIHGTMRPRGYNLTDGGMGTPGARRPHSEEAKRKIGAAHRGKKASPQARAKMSAAKKGKRPSAQLRVLWSAQRKGRPIPKETASKIAAAHLGKTRPIRALAFLLKALASVDIGTSKNIRPEHGRFSTRINIGGQRRKHLGTFDTYDEALAAYRAAVVVRIEEIRAAHGSIGSAIIAKPDAA